MQVSGFWLNIQMSKKPHTNIKVEKQAPRHPPKSTVISVFLETLNKVFQPVRMLTTVRDSDDFYGFIFLIHEKYDFVFPFGDKTIHLIVTTDFMNNGSSGR